MVEMPQHARPWNSSGIQDITCILVAEFRTKNRAGHLEIGESFIHPHDIEFRKTHVEIAGLIFTTIDEVNLVIFLNATELILHLSDGSTHQDDNHVTEAGSDCRREGSYN